MYISLRRAAIQRKNSPRSSNPPHSPRRPVHLRNHPPRSLSPSTALRPQNPPSAPPCTQIAPPQYTLRAPWFPKLPSWFPKLSEHFGNPLAALKLRFPTRPVPVPAHAPPPRQSALVWKQSFQAAPAFPKRSATFGNERTARAHEKTPSALLPRGYRPRPSDHRESFIRG